MLNTSQANKFAKTFGLTNLHQVNGEWYATDSDCGIYHISEENYYNALDAGDL
ncbi:MAG: hypothetical protein HC851_19150 [Acaryochloris sp. RU_4_1]|nr:hypothetical protein [Acaryochloris sp. RU_4_1]NJR55651.1 hypothetical protein [Acaryochloris sp. CRU_2_0]